MFVIMCLCDERISMYRYITALLLQYRRARYTRQLYSYMRMFLASKQERYLLYSDKASFLRSRQVVE